MEVVEQGTEAGDVVLEGRRVDVGYVGQSNGRNVASGGSTVGGGSRGGRSQEASADYGRLQEGRDGCITFRRGMVDGVCGLTGSAPFWPASLSE